MVKKVVLLLAFMLYTGLIQNSAFSQDQYADEFYLNNLQKKIESNWINPETPKNAFVQKKVEYDVTNPEPTNQEQAFSSNAFFLFTPNRDNYKSTLVSIFIDKDGRLSNAEILRSSNDKQFDKSAIDAVYKADSFGPLTNNKNSLNVLFFFSPAFTSMTIPNGNINKIDSNIVDVANKTFYGSSSSYTDELQARIKSNWNPTSVKKNREVIASVKIGKDGSLENIELVKSSRGKKFDRDAITAISKSVPMASLPDNVQSESRNVQVTFRFKDLPVEKNVKPEGKVTSKMSNINGYDEYTKQVEQVMAYSLTGRYFWLKELVLEVTINKDGSVNYVKIQKPSKDKFDFDRKILTILQKASFPPIPDEMGLDKITLNYEVITQRGHSFKDVVAFVLLHFGWKGLTSFCI